MLCAAGFTVSVSTADVPARNAASPLYAAVIACVPTVSEEVVYPTAPPLRPTVPPGSAVPLSEKVSVPVGRPKKGAAGGTDPVNVTDCTADVPARNAASPLYAAVIACVPTVSEEVVYPTAPPLRPTVPPGSAAPLSEKVSVPA